jgi:hypothetical protein
VALFFTRERIKEADSTQRKDPSIHDRALMARLTVSSSPLKRP